MDEAHQLPARTPADLMRRALIATVVLLLAAIPGQARAARATVAVSDSAYSPPTVRILANDDVFWCPNADNAKTHSVTADDGSFDSLDLPPHSGCTWLTFQHDGQFPYHCRFVAGMKGTVIVGAGAPATTTAATAARPTVTTAKPSTATTPHSSHAVVAAAVRATSSTARRVDDTTSTFSSAGDTTTTAGQMAIRVASHNSGGGRTALGMALVAMVLAGGGYVAYRRGQLSGRA